MMIQQDFYWTVYKKEDIENQKFLSGFDHVDYDMPELNFGSTKDGFQYYKISLGKTRPEGQVSPSVQLKEIENDGKDFMIKQHLRKIQENPASLHEPVEKLHENDVHVSKEIKTEDKKRCSIEAILQCIRGYFDDKNDENISLKILEVKFVQGERQWLIRCFTVYIPRLNIVLVPSPVLSNHFCERGPRLVDKGSSLWKNAFSKLSVSAKIIFISLLLPVLFAIGSAGLVKSNPVENALEISVVEPITLNKNVLLTCNCNGDCKGLIKRWKGGQDNADLTTNGHVLAEGIELMENSDYRYSIKIVNATGKYIYFNMTCFFGSLSKEIKLAVQTVVSSTSVVSTVTTTPKKSNYSGLSYGAIAGIVVGLVTAIAFIAFIAFIICRVVFQRCQCRSPCWYRGEKVPTNNIDNMHNL